MTVLKLIQLLNSATNSDCEVIVQVRDGSDEGIRKVKSIRCTDKTVELIYEKEDDGNY